ncbi:hypothetical protein HQ489_05395, partial [Candidatus Woesearchaeota archaeon]|nr:hypothetical protein [Candidatus Woesearchaeota archaeon]
MRNKDHNQEREESFPNLEGAISNKSSYNVLEAMHWLSGRQSGVSTGEIREWIQKEKGISWVNRHIQKIIKNLIDQNIVTKESGKYYLSETIYSIIDEVIG